jgi:hypothetical protein
MVPVEVTALTEHNPMGHQSLRDCCKVELAGIWWPFDKGLQLKLNIGSSGARCDVLNATLAWQWKEKIRNDVSLA